MKPPKYIYRYCKWDDRTKLALLRNMLYAPAPIQFNDPFDSRLPASFDHNAPEFHHQWEKSSSAIADWNRKNPLKPVLNVRLNAGIALKSAYDQFLEIVNRYTRLLCFTRTRNSLLMWAHYADGHTGVCLRFRVQAGSALSAVKQVEYSDACPRIDLYNDREIDIVEKSMLWKSRIWSHEKEWRLILHNAKDEYVMFNPYDLVGIVIGCSMSRDARRDVCSIMHERKSPVIIYEAIKNEWKYKVNIEGMLRFG